MGQHSETELFKESNVMLKLREIEYEYNDVLLFFHFQKFFLKGMEIVTSFKKLNYGRFSKKEAPIFLFLFNKKNTWNL